jgi:DNA-binding PadR family transcriptional regulator
MNPKNENYKTPAQESYSQNTHVEDILKKHLSIVVLCTIRNNSMSGQDIAKEIFFKYHVYISPSAIYSILYSLKDQNLLEIDTVKGDLRTKYYVPTEIGKPAIDKQVKEFKEALEYFIVSLDNRLP